MKKIAVGLIAVFGLVFLQPVHAEEKSLVIIDQYFDVSKISGSVTVICVALDKCKNMPKSSGIANSKDGHGTAMAEIARINNPTAPLILIRSSQVTPKGEVYEPTVIEFFNALTWVNKNHSNVFAISTSMNLSGNMSNPTDCKPTSNGGVNVKQYDLLVRDMVSQLKLKNIPVFAATGNDRTRKPVYYPACLVDVVSVGASDKDGQIYYLSNFDSNTDYFVRITEGQISYASSVFGKIAWTTSTATAALAASWPNIVDKTNKFVLVKP